MSAPQISSRRKAFTLVELLVAMAIIGILVALLLPAVQSVRRSAWEATVAMDMAQLDMAVDKFKTDYGHFPTDFSEFVDANGDALGWFDVIPAPFDITVENRWRQILAKISPTHNEMAFDDPEDTMKSRMQIWWETVGVQLAVYEAEPTTTKSARLRGPQVALWFWMTQVFNDAQYPITGPRQGIDRASGYYLILDSAEQKKFFDFPAGDLELLPVEGDDSDFEIEYPNDMDTSTAFQVARALQRRGDAPLIYFHHQTYDDPYAAPDTSTFINFEPNAAVGDPPNLGLACREPSVAAGSPFVQPNTYQILTAGADESFGDVEDRTVYENNDNLCNFSEGRLDAFVDNFENNN